MRAGSVGAAGVVRRSRARVAAFDLAALDWWDRMFGADLVVSSLCLHHLNDAKKQYLYKAVAERLSAARRAARSPISSTRSTPRRAAWPPIGGTRRREQQADALGAPELFRAVRRRRAGTTSGFRTRPISRQRCCIIWSGCGTPASRRSIACWLEPGHAVFGGFKQAAASASRLPADS